MRNKAYIRWWKWLVPISACVVAILPGGWRFTNQTPAETAQSLLNNAQPMAYANPIDEHIVILPPTKIPAQSIQMAQTPPKLATAPKQPVQPPSKPTTVPKQPAQTPTKPAPAPKQPAPSPVQPAPPQTPPDKASTIPEPEPIKPVPPPQRAKFEPENGAYIGAYTELNSLLNRSMVAFNQVTGKKHASFFKYVGYGMPFPTQWVEEVKALGALPQIAWEPNNGLAQVQDDAYLRSFAKAAREADTPIFLRYASEMNVGWMAYSGNPQLFIEKWRLIHRVMREEAPNVAMLWVVAALPQETITAYYPGDDYVDWVGVNVYSVVYHNNNIQERADHEDPIELARFVYDRFSKTKPIVIGEFGATHDTITDDADHVPFALEKLKRMYTGVKEQLPRVKAIYYFDVNCIIDALPGRRINNYSVTDHPLVLEQYKQLIADPYFLSDIDYYNEDGLPSFTF